MRYDSIKRLNRQRGLATLITAIILLLLVTVVTFYSSKTLVFEQKTSVNQMRSQQAFEAAEYGLERGVAWLQTRSASPNIENWNAASANACKAPTDPGTDGVYSIYAAAWGAMNGASRQLDVSSQCNRNIPTTLTVTMGNLSYTVNLSYVQTVTTLKDLGYVKILADATASDTAMGGTAHVEQIVALPGGPSGTGGLADSPIIVKGCTTGITGNPDICPANVSAGNANISGAGGAPDCTTNTGTTGVAITTLQAEPANPDDCLDMGHFASHGGTRSFLNTPSATVWDTLFPNGRLTEAMVQSLAGAGVPGFVYYDSAHMPGTGKIPAQGTTAQPVLIYVDSSAGCLTLAPGDFVALIYYETTASCNLQGGGSADLTGTIAVEGTINKFNANTIIRNSGFTGDWEDDVVEGANTFARVPGSWKDYQ